MDCSRLQGRPTHCIYCDTRNLFVPLVSLKEVLPSIERRTWQLLYALEERQQNGVVDVGATLGHWAFDVMVRLCHFHLREGRSLVYTGRCRIWRHD